MVNSLVKVFILILVQVMVTCMAAQVTSFVNVRHGTISTIAGTGAKGYNSDGILATTAQLRTSNGVAENSLGEVLIADQNNHRIRKILLNGTITTIAGTGNAGHNGDGILATSAQLNNPTGVAVNSLGEILIADSGNNRVRKIQLNGFITTIAGIGNGGYNGDNILATSAQLSEPTGVALNSLDEVFIADTSNHRIRKIQLNGIITTVSGAGLNFPRGVAVNSLGEVLIAGFGDHRISKILLNGMTTTIAGTGVGGYNSDGILATSAHLYNPTGVAVNSLDEVFIADCFNHRIRKILLNGTITTVAGTGIGGYNSDGILATSAQLYNPAGVAVNSLGDIIIGDQNNDRVRKFMDACPAHSSQSGEQCNCLAGYFGNGQYCNKFNCSGIVNDRPDVCSSNGKCVSPNNCTCNTGHTGTNCEVFGCYGKSSTDSTVCSGRGICTGHNKCSCNTGYSGNCDTYYCTDILFSNTSVCSGVGQCTTPNNCICNNGYYGSTCEQYNCFGRSKGDRLGCSGIGVCKGPDQCECPSTNLNSDCSQKQSNGTNVDAKAATTDQTTVLIAAIVPFVAVLLIILAILVVIIIVVAVCSRRKKSGQHHADQLVPIQNIASYEMRPFAHSTPVSDFPSQYSNSSKLSQVNDPMDRYTDMVKIGQGGFGSVYKVKDTKAGNETKAIKVIRFENNGDLNLAMKEGIQLLKMNHPNVLKVNDFFIGNGQILCIDMVYYEIGDLNKLIYGTNFCSERVISQILLQSCSALDYIYKNFGYE